MNNKCIDSSINKSNFIIDRLPIYSIVIYIISVFIFSADVKLNIISRLAFLFMVCICGLYILVSTHNNIQSKVGAWSVGVLVLCVLSVFWSIDRSFALNKVWTVAQLVVLFVLVYAVLDSREKINFIINSIIVSGYVMYLYMFLTIGIQNTLSMFSDGLRVGDEINQENTFGYYSAIVFALSLYQLVYKNKKIYFLFLPLPVLMGVFSGSKKSLLLLIIILFILLTFKKKTHIVSRMFFSILVIMIVGLVLSELGFLDLVVSRVDDALGGEDASTNERLKFINFGWEKFLDRPLFGYGIEQFEILYEQQFLSRHPSHNNYIQLLTSFGLAGLLLWYSIYIWFIKIGIKNFYIDKLAPLIVLIVIITFVNDITTTTLTNKFTYILIALCFAITTIMKKENSLRTNSYE